MNHRGPSLTDALAARRFLLMDAAMGSALLAAGFAATPETVLHHAAAVHAIHAAHVAAGAEVLLSCTFQANPPALARRGLDSQLERIGQKAIFLARRAAPTGWVLGDVGPFGTPEFADRTALRRTLAALEGVDGILFETCSSPAALDAVAFAFHRVPEVEGVPLLLSLTYQRNLQGELVTHSGHAPETYARHAARHGIAALGVNCGLEIDLGDAAEILRRYRAHTDLPLFARPNAGTPDDRGGYPCTPDDFAQAVGFFLSAGASMLGGCCGTTAEHLAAMKTAAPST